MKNKNSLKTSSVIFGLLVFFVVIFLIVLNNNDDNKTLSNSTMQRCMSAAAQPLQGLLEGRNSEKEAFQKWCLIALRQARKVIECAGATPCIIQGTAATHPTIITMILKVNWSLSLTTQLAMPAPACRQAALGFRSLSLQVGL